MALMSMSAWAGSPALQATPGRPISIFSAPRIAAEACSLRDGLRDMQPRDWEPEEAFLERKRKEQQFLEQELSKRYLFESTVSVSLDAKDPTKVIVSLAGPGKGAIEYAGSDCRVVNELITCSYQTSDRDSVERVVKKAYGYSALLDAQVKMEPTKCIMGVSGVHLMYHADEQREWS